MPEPLLATTGLRAGYGGKPVLQGVDLAVRPGEIVAVIGRNGVGKTSLLRAILGLQPISDGRVQWQERDVTRLPAHKRARSGFASVPQGRDIFARLTVAENLRTGFAAAPALGLALAPQLRARHL